MSDETSNGSSIIRPRSMVSSSGTEPSRGECRRRPPGCQSPRTGGRLRSACGEEVLARVAVDRVAQLVAGAVQEHPQVAGRDPERLAHLVRVAAVDRVHRERARHLLRQMAEVLVERAPELLPCGRVLRVKSGSCRLAGSPGLELV